MRERGKEIARVKHPPEAHASVGRWMNTVFHPFAFAQWLYYTARFAEWLSFKSEGRFACLRLTFTVKSRAAGAAGLPFAQWCLKDLRYRGWNLFLLFLVALAIFMRICTRVSTHTRTHITAIQIELQLIMKYYRCVVPCECENFTLRHENVHLTKTHNRPAWNLRNRRGHLDILF